METINLYELKKLQTNFPKEKITDSNVAYNFIKQFYGDDLEIFESAFILLLNQASQTIGYAKISQGGITGTVIDVRLVAKYAVESLATGVILAHNHPSGNTTPSEADKRMTERCKNALATLDITLVDHLIITEESFTSFADRGML